MMEGLPGGGTDGDEMEGSRGDGETGEDVIVESTGGGATGGVELDI